MLDMTAYIPRGKSDTRRAMAAAALGYPGIEPILGDLLAWTADGNWPVARILDELLASVGPPLAPHVRLVLASNDNTWKYFLLVDIVAYSETLASALMPELQRLVTAPTIGEQSEGVDEIAAEIISVL